MVTCHPDWADPSCPQCAVMRACLAAVPGIFHGPQAVPETHRPTHVHPDTAGLRLWAGLHRYEQFGRRSILAQQVAYRLIAWARWPGEERRRSGRTSAQLRNARDEALRSGRRVVFVCGNEANRDHADALCRHLGIDHVRVVDSVPREGAIRGVPTLVLFDHAWLTLADENDHRRRARLSSAELVAHTVLTFPLHHPLDATPAGGLRPATTLMPCHKCRSRVVTCQHEPTFANGVASDWPALAVITDAMSEAALWPALHAWREPSVPDEFDEISRHMNRRNMQALSSDLASMDWAAMRATGLLD